MAQGIQWAIEQHVDFIMISAGTTYPLEVVQRAVHAAHREGIMIFCTASVHGRAQLLSYPAAFAETLSVGLSHGDGHRFVSTHKASCEVNILAKGAHVLSSYPPMGFASLSGPSMATHIAGGVAALIAARYKRIKGERPSLGTRAFADMLSLLLG